jgi:signal transduction histidine kinase
MNAAAKNRLTSWAAFALLASVLAWLAVLQYRWSREVSQAASTRMQEGLHMAMFQFRDDLSRELGHIAQEFNPSAQSEGVPDARRYSEHLRHWQETAAHRGLIERVYVFRGSQSKLLSLDPSTERLEDVAWPPEFTRLQQQLRTITPGVETIAQHHPDFEPSGGPHGSADFRHGAGDRRLPPPPHDFGAHLYRPHDHLGGPHDRSRSPESDMPWAIDQHIPALVRPIFGSPSATGPQLSWLIIRLNSTVLNRHIIPELVAREFSGATGLNYEVAVRFAGDSTGALYSTDQGFGSEPATVSDAVMALWFGGPGHNNAAGGAFRPMPRVPHSEAPVTGYKQPGEPPGVRFIALHYSPDEPDWEVIAKHRSGSLEAAVTSLRRRNLAVSFGILLVLAATAGLIIVVSQRARSLAQLQMTFVAGVSHELRTPLSVISSAAQNIADGVVTNQQQLTRYAGVIHSQAKQLGDLVDQVLLFASLSNAKAQYQNVPLSVATIVESALEGTAEAVRAGRATVEVDIAPGLPAVSGSLNALCQCLQNLITNAVKYGGDVRWVGIAARLSAPGEVAITVSDRGPGIPQQDLHRIFEPFYRGEEANASQIHGTGLGLPLARTIAEAMGGRLEARSEPGVGSAFTVLLQAVAAQTANPAILRSSAQPGPVA